MTADVEIPEHIPECHRAMYVEWVKRGKPQMESITPRHSCWLDIKGDPIWISNHQYRFKDSPLDEKSKAMRHLVDELPIAKFDPRIAKEADAKVEAWMDSAIAHGIMASPEQLAAGLPKAEPTEHDAGLPTSALQTQVGGEHYAKMKIQPVEFIHANNLNFIEGCIVKYVARHRAKNGKQDLEKAKHFLEMLIELEYGDEG